MEPYIPQDAIVMLHGKWGTFKTPITLNIGKSIAQGLDELWGCKLNKTKVLYIEADTPEMVIVPRMQTLNVDVEGLDFFFAYPGFNLLDPYGPRTDPEERKCYEDLRKLHQANKYGLIVVDCLRVLHQLDDKESTTPPQVYKAFKRLFPGATVLVIHHDKKTQMDDTPGSESFSGSAAWVNQATTTLKVTYLDRGQCHVQVEMTKSQASDTMAAPLKLEVTEGILCKSLVSSKLDDIADYLENKIDAQSFHSIGELDKHVGQMFGVHPKTIQRRRKELELTRDGFLDKMRDLFYFYK